LDTGLQFLIAAIIACIIGIPILFHKHNKYKQEGKSIKYLELKILITVGIPIMSVPVLLSNASLVWKIFTIIVMVLSGSAYVYSIASARKTLRKIMGRPPEDEHTGEVIKKGETKEK